VNFRTEPDNPVIHLPLGKISFTDDMIEDNVKAFVDSIGITKIAKFTLTSTMGPGIRVGLE
jgi:ribosomal protein L1